MFSKVLLEETKGGGKEENNRVNNIEMHHIFFVFFFFFFGAGIKPRAWRMLGKRCATELHPCPKMHHI
jgi:hypothetical protein